MKEYFEFFRLDREEITEEQFEQVVLVEQSGSEDCYTREQLRDMWVEGIKNDNFVCVNDEDKIVGIITFNPFSQKRNGSIYVVNLTVMPEYRRKGIASQLIKSGVTYYLNNRFTVPMSISVDKDNIPALNLYRKVGFRIGNPIAEIDRDDTQYILDASLDVLDENIRNTIVRKR